MRVVLFGDSVFAGYGLSPADAPAALVADRLAGIDVQGAGVPDETAADGLARVARIAGDLVFVEFGLNDAIQGVAPAATAEALGAIVDDLRRRGARVALVEALVPATSTWPPLHDHTGLAQRVADEHGAAFCPDLLAYRRTHPAAVQDDGLHPDSTGAHLIADRLAACVRHLATSGARP